MTISVRNVAVILAVATVLGCGVDGSYATKPEEVEQGIVDDSPVKTSAGSYRLSQEQGGGVATIKASYRNETGRDLYYSQCGMAYVRRTGADSLRKLFTVYGVCTMATPIQVLRRGESLQLTVMFGTPAQARMTPPLQPEWMSGTMRILLNLCARDSKGGCTTLPDRERQSNAFELYY